MGLIKKLLEYYTSPYLNHPLDRQRKARAVAVLNLVFIFLLLAYLSITLISTGGLINHDALLVMGMSLFMGLTFFLLRTGRLGPTVLLTLGLVFLLFTLILFVGLATGREIFRVYSMGFYYMFVLLLGGLIGTHYGQSIMIGMASILVLSIFYFFQIMPYNPPGFIGNGDAYVAVLFMLLAGTLISSYLNAQLSEIFSEFSLLNRNLESEVSTRTRELRDALEQLQFSKGRLVESEKLAALGGLVGGISHEINTPLGNSLTAGTHAERVLEGLKVSFDNSRMTRSSFEQAVRDIADAQGIIQRNLRAAIDLLERFKRISMDQHQEQVQNFRVRDEIDNVMVSHQNTLKRLDQLEIVIEGQKDLEVYSYPGLFWQILTNLLQNSIRHGLPEGRGLIRIEYGIHQGSKPELLITFQDNGRGMAKNIRDRMYEPFFTTNREGGGTGLGLNIVYNIITQLEGEISCITAPGQGTRFILRLPLTEPAPLPRSGTLENI